MAHADDESAWRTSWDGTLYGYANSMGVRNDSVLNPNNALARLPERSGIVEGRFNFKAENESLRFSARPIVLAQREVIAGIPTDKTDGFLSQWQTRWKVRDDWALSGGREVLNWGAAQFRSPSNPFYFNNGRSNPMSELSGMESLRLSWSPDVNTTLYMARLFGSGHGHDNPDPWTDSWLTKADLRGEGWAGGVALAKQPGHLLFIGAHGQQSIGDEWLLYAELGSSSRTNALISSVDMNLPFFIEGETTRRTNALVGGNYTAENGQSLAVEYLHYDFGYDRQEVAAFFARASQAANTLASPSSQQTLGMALSAAPQLLGRDYVHMVWQSNLMESSRYWRVMVTHSFTDGNNELAGYTEKALSSRYTAFALAQITAGGAQQEFSRLLNHFLTLGIKVALP